MKYLVSTIYILCIQTVSLLARITTYDKKTEKETQYFLQALVSDNNRETKEVQSKNGIEKDKFVNWVEIFFPGNFTYLHDHCSAVNNDRHKTLPALNWNICKETSYRDRLSTKHGIYDKSVEDHWEVEKQNKNSDKENEGNQITFKNLTNNVFSNYKEHLTAKAAKNDHKRQDLNEGYLRNLRRPFKQCFKIFWYDLTEACIDFDCLIEVKNQLSVSVLGSILHELNFSKVQKKLHLPCIDQYCIAHVFDSLIFCLKF